MLGWSPSEREALPSVALKPEQITDYGILDMPPVVALDARGDAENLRNGGFYFNKRLIHSPPPRETNAPDRRHRRRARDARQRNYDAEKRQKVAGLK